MIEIIFISMSPTSRNIIIAKYKLGIVSTLSVVLEVKYITVHLRVKEEEIVNERFK